MRLIFARTFSAFALVLVFGVGALTARAQTYFSDDFDTYATGDWTQGSSYGSYTLQFNGYGNGGIEADVTRPGYNALFEEPEVSTSSDVSHSCLITRNGTMNNLDVTAWVDNLQQLRQNSPPNPWEVGWILWHYTDNTHFYSFALQTNGWVLAKEDPSYPGNQDFLASGSTPAATIGTPYYVEVIQSTGGAITVKVNGSTVVNYTDSMCPYTSGLYGLYCEDSYVHYYGIYGVYY